MTQRSNGRKFSLWLRPREQFTSIYFMCKYYIPRYQKSFVEKMHFLVFLALWSWLPEKETASRHTGLFTKWQLRVLIQISAWVIEDIVFHFCFLLKLKNRISVMRYVVLHGRLWDDLYIGFQNRISRDPDIYHHRYMHLPLFQLSPHPSAVNLLLRSNDFHLKRGNMRKTA